MSSLFASAFGTAAIRLATQQTSPQVHQLGTSERVMTAQVNNNSLGGNAERMSRTPNSAAGGGQDLAEARPSTATSVEHQKEDAKTTWMSKWRSTPRTIGERSPSRARCRMLAPVKIVPFKPPKLNSDSEDSDDEYIPRAPIGQPAFPTPPPAYEEHCPQDQKIQATVVTPAPPSGSTNAPPPYESRNSERSTGTADDSSLGSAQEADDLASQQVQKPLGGGTGTELSSICVSQSASEMEEQPTASETTDSPIPAWMLKWTSRERNESTLSDSTLALNAPLPDEDDPFPDDDASLASDSEFHTANTTASEPQSCKAKVRSARHRARYAQTDSECDSADSSSVASMSVLAIHDEGEDEDVTLGDVSDAHMYLTAEEDLD